jgi:Flp pilus assembly protein TadD
VPAPAHSAPPAPWPLRVLDAAAARPRRLVAVAALLPFLLTLQAPPVLDDGWAVVDNPLVQGGLSNAARILASHYGYAGGATLAGAYRPLTTLTFAASYAVHGRHPLGYHLVNLALHALASLLVLALARRLADAASPRIAPRVAVLAGLLFAVHPAHVESIAPMVGRGDLLAACGALASLAVALGGRGAARSPGRLAAAAALLAGAVLAKESAAVVPALYAILAVAVPGAAGLEARPGLATAPARRALARTAVVSAALGLAVVLYVVLRGTPVGSPPASQWFAGVPRTSVALTTSRILAEYLRILAFPGFLGTDFAYAARVRLLSAPDAGFWAATAAWGAVLAGALLAARRAPLPSAGLLWTFAALLPVLHLVPIGVLMAERLLYLPSVGFCIAAGAWIAAAASAAGGGGAGRPAAPSRRASAAALLSLAAVAALAVRSTVRAADWRDGVSLWTSELPKAPRDPVVNNNLAVALSARGEHARALARSEAAIAASPGYWRAHVNLGIAAQALGDVDRARGAYLEAARLAPEASAPPFFLARLLAERGDLEGALAQVAAARGLAPEEARLAAMQGRLLARLGRPAEARAAFEAALALDPADAEARAALAPSRAAGPPDSP